MNENVGSITGLTTVMFESINGVDRLPIGACRSAERIDTQLETGAANGVHIDDIFEVANIGQDEVLLVDAGCLDGLGKGDTFHALIAGLEQLIRTVLDPFCYIGIGWTACGRVVFEASILGRIVRRRDDNAVCQVFFATAVVHEDGVRNYRRRGDPVALLDDCLDAVGCKHFKSRALRGGPTGRGCPSPM